MTSSLRALLLVEITERLIQAFLEDERLRKSQKTKNVIDIRLNMAKDDVAVSKFHKLEKMREAAKAGAGHVIDGAKFKPIFYSLKSEVFAP
jgi:hypothetical protein